MITRIVRRFRFGVLMLGLLGPGLLWLILPALVWADFGQVEDGYTKFF
jgi:hypothetical protein